MTHTSARNVAPSALRAVLYLRQSKDATGEMRAVDRQRQAVTDYCARRGWAIVREYVDNDISASSRKPRPDFERMMSDADQDDRDFDVIVSWQLDRLTRRPIEAERFIDMWERNGMLIATMSGDVDLETEEGRLKLRLIIAIARMEIDRKSNRQKTANEQSRSEGKLPSQRAFGFVGSELHPLEAPALRNAYAELLAGESFVSIARHITAQGFRTRRTNAPINNVTIREIMRNPRNCGYRGQDGELSGKGNWEPIVDREIWEAAMQIMDTNQASHHGMGTARRWIGAGLYVCGRCGGSFKTSINGSVKNEAHRRSYYCRGLDLTRSNGEAIDAFVEDEIVDRFSNPALTSRLLDDSSDQIIAIKQQLAALDVNERRVHDDRADGDLDKEQYRRQLDRIDGRRVALRAELGSFVGNNVLGPVMRSADPAAHYLSLPITMRQKVINAIAVVTLLPTGVGGDRRRGFDSTSVDIAWRDEPIG